MRIIFGFLILTLSACSATRTAPTKLVIEKRWTRATPEKVFLGNRRVHRFTPILSERTVFVGNAIDGVVAYDRDSAQVKWRVSIKDGVEGGGVLSDGLLYFGASDGQLYALNADTGAILWTYPLKSEGLGRPFVKAGVLYILGGNNVAHAIEAKTGKLLWLYNRREASNISVRGAAQPVVVNDNVLIGFSDGAFVALNKTSGAVVWETNLNHNKRFKDVDATPVIDGDTAYVSSYDGGLYAVGLSDGRILWSIDDGGFDEVSMQGSTIYYSSSSGKTYAVDKTSGKVLWSKENKGGIATGPVIFKGTLVVDELDGAMRFYDMRTGELLNDFESGRGLTSRAAVDVKKGEVYALSHDANLYALKVNWKRFSKDWPWD